MHMHIYIYIYYNNIHIHIYIYTYIYIYIYVYISYIERESVYIYQCHNIVYDVTKPLNDTSSQGPRRAGSRCYTTMSGP